MATALAGAFIANMTTQFAGTNLADIQGGVAASADEASWVGTAYTVANLVGIVAAPTLLRTFGLRRYFVASAVVFAACAWWCALAPGLAALVAARIVQGCAGGAFGPIAFTAVFAMLKGPRVALGIALLAFVLLVSVNVGPALAGPIEAAWGWRGLFVVQLWAAVLLALAGMRWMPPPAAINREALRIDWGAAALLALAVGGLMLVVSQGTRRFWLDNPMVAWTLSLSVGAWLGFVVAHWLSSTPLLNMAKLRERRFGLAIALNFIFRSSFAATVYLLPLLLASTQAYRPLQVSHLLWWSVLPQIATFPVVWQLLHRHDSRTIMIAGLLLCGLALWLASRATTQVAGEQLQLSLVLLGIGQMLFLVPTLLVGALGLSMADGPTATIAFNLTTVGGTTVGVGLVSHFVTEREKFHSSVLVDRVSWLDGQVSDRLSTLGTAWSARLGDEVASRGALAQLGAGVRREAWLLAFNDGFALIAIALVLATLGVALVGRSPPLSNAPQADSP
ncbi:MFS transporter [Lysobacter sp. S4-A87]|uniref:MFS transporter n=1 Tax=Lysobacter sp. S4-A87 TaxID=2925843 RepID=UPI001F539DC8|nr:MFS transporter [Lysobacter sp. S4-A87]UNK50146.1 MFS transporter [Lysobacter sp. S4-A87]